MDNQIEINLDQTIIQVVNTADDLTILLEDCSKLYLFGEHDQDCCESVELDIGEIPQSLLDELEGEYLHTFSVIKLEEGGINLIFDIRRRHPLDGEPWDKVIHVGAHNIQNGYYSSDLSVVVEHLPGTTEPIGVTHTYRLDELEFTYEELY